MKQQTRTALAQLFLPILVAGSVYAQSDQSGDPSRFLANTDRANPLVAKAAGLVPQSGQGEEIRAAFNANADRVRLMVLLSPT